MMKKKIPASANEWLIEIAEAYKDAEDAIPFGPAAGVDITEGMLFHIAPSVCVKFRGALSPCRSVLNCGYFGLYVLKLSYKEG